jgi:hypothetical protein
MTIENLDQSDRNNLMNYGSRNNKNKLVIDQESCDIQLELELDELPGITQIIDGETLELEYSADKPSDNKSRSSSESSENTSNNSEHNYSEDDEENTREAGDEKEDEESVWESESDTESDTESESDESSVAEEDETHAYIHDFPVQMICLEKCHGTLDELLVKRVMNEEMGASALFQIIMTLIIYQKMFHFTHNDLHTNNIMFVETDQEFLDYYYNGKYYRVPTYGKIYKLIDFGRAIYKFKGKQFCSDSFANGGDAATQYNFEPFMNKKKPRLEPNYSFDLSRLACSVFDFLIDREECDITKLDKFQRIIYDWCLDDNGKNMLYKRDGDERYPNFKLYKMIARAVHHCVPHEQLENPFFAQFESGITTEQCMNIDELPCYC